MVSLSTFLPYASAISRTRNENWINRKWKPRENLEPDLKNVIRESLIDSVKVSAHNSSRHFTRDEEFEKTMTPVEKKAYVEFKNVVNGFLGNTKSPNFKTLVNNILQAFRKLGRNMGLTWHMDYLKVLVSVFNF